VKTRFQRLLQNRRFKNRTRLWLAFGSILSVLSVANAHPWNEGGRQAESRPVGLAKSDSGKSGVLQSTSIPSPLPAQLALSDSSVADSLVSDSTAPDDSGSAALGNPIYEYIAYPTLQLITWPVENFLVPTVGALVYPFKPPLQYVLNENVIDRTINMFSFGPNEKIMVYPTMSIAPGTSSRMGLTLRHRALFGSPDEGLVAQWTMYVNGDYKMRAYVTLDKMFDSDFYSKFSATLVRVKNSSVNQPNESDFWFFSDTTEIYNASLGHSLWERFSTKGQYTLRINRYGLAPPQSNVLKSDFFFPNGDTSLAPDPTIRGLQQEWQDNIFGIFLNRDSRNNSNITLDGSRLDASWSYHLTTKGHDYHEYQVIFDKYFKLGRERYELSREEEREVIRGMNVKDLLTRLEYRKLREQFFNRKVLAMRFYVAQSFDVPDNTMPYYGLQILGNDTPLRGYNGSRFRNYTVAALSTEYRFPLMRLVDGNIFNEYGIHGHDLQTMKMSNFKNSWGFGLRVRRPDIFLFRCEAGFHGAQGITLNLTVDTVY
jgi:hypothetical protein